MTLRWARFLGMHVCSFCVNRQQTVVRLAISFFSRNAVFAVFLTLNSRRGMFWSWFTRGGRGCVQVEQHSQSVQSLSSQTFDYAALANCIRYTLRNCGVSPVPTYNQAARNLLSNSRVLLSVTLQRLFNSISQLSINDRSRAKMTSMRFRSRPGLHTA